MKNNNWTINNPKTTAAPDTQEKYNGLTKATYVTNSASKDEKVRTVAEFVLNNWDILSTTGGNS